MRPDRRRHLVLGLSAALAACTKGVRSSQAFDGKLLDHEFPTLADRARPGAFNAAIFDLQTNAGWYWNVPALGDSIALDPSTAEHRPCYSTRCP